MPPRASRYLLRPSKALRSIWTLLGFRHHRPLDLPPLGVRGPRRRTMCAPRLRRPACPDLAPTPSTQPHDVC